MPRSVVPSIVDDAFWAGTQEKRDIDLLWVGSCAPNKQPHVFLDVAEQLPEARCAMVIAPGRNAELNEAVARRAEAIPNLQYLGFVPFRDMPAMYLRSRILVQTSLLEGFPNVVLQAWQAGLAVVSLRIDPDGVIQKNSIGLVSGSFPRLLQDVRHLLDSPATCVEIAYKGRQYVRQHHSSAVIADRFIEVFDSLNDGRTPA